ncbi:hypothetical protein M422DRAFT_44475 [Sphaerobolus stellatus SS14]|nr:hypothetical protein M422DRAFT_44475 [Sphaerobolus stellatus SS14]
MVSFGRSYGRMVSMKFYYFTNSYVEARRLWAELLSRDIPDNIVDRLLKVYKPLPFNTTSEEYAKLYGRILRMVKAASIRFKMRGTAQVLIAVRPQFTSLIRCSTET